MIEQTFSTGDIGIVLFLVLLEGLLSADNALVLAIMVRHLPRPLQKKALLYGLGGAFVFRLIAILLAQWIIQLWWAQAIGAAYLIYLPIKHFIHHSTKHLEGKRKGGGFWQTVVAVEIADIAFAVDSVLVAVGLVKQPDKLWVIYFGAIIGVILLRFAAGVFVGMLERYPKLDHLAYVIVGWVGVKLAFMAAHNFTVATKQPVLGQHVSELNPAVFWSVLGLICLVGGIVAFRDPHRPTSPEQQDSTD